MCPTGLQLQRFVCGESPRPEAAAVVRHLLTQCPSCVAVARRLWQLGEPRPDFKALVRERLSKAARDLRGHDEPGLI